MGRPFLNLVLAILFGVACAGASSPRAADTAQDDSTIPVGQWGGAHVSLQAGTAGAALQFDCAHGTIPAPLTLGSEGQFRLSGTFVREHGGPNRVGEAENSQSASYSGTIQGSTMTLSIDLSRDKATVGPFSLEFQSPGQIVRCR